MARLCSQGPLTMHECPSGGQKDSVTEEGQTRVDVSPVQDIDCDLDDRECFSKDKDVKLNKIK